MARQSNWLFLLIIFKACYLCELYLNLFLEIKINCTNFCQWIILLSPVLPFSKAWPRFRSTVGKSFFLKVPHLFVHCPISFWPPPPPPSLSNGDSGNLFGTFLPFPVQSNFHFELGCLSVIDAQNHHGKSFAAPKSRKCPFQHEKSCSKPSGQTGNAQIQKHQKGASFILLSYHW